MIFILRTLPEIETCPLASRQARVGVMARSCKVAERRAVSFMIKKLRLRGWLVVVVVVDIKVRKT